MGSTEREATRAVQRKNLFTEKGERWTDDANRISNEFTDAVRPIFEKYYAQGYRVRDISHILMGVAFEEEVLTVL